MNKSIPAEKLMQAAREAAQLAYAHTRNLPLEQHF
jgi:hypothetical protein